jgi:hypothetical protein
MSTDTSTNTNTNTNPQIQTHGNGNTNRTLTCDVWFTVESEDLTCVDYIPSKLAVIPTTVPRPRSLNLNSEGRRTGLTAGVSGELKLVGIRRGRTDKRQVLRAAHHTHVPPLCADCFTIDTHKLSVPYSY